MTKNVFVNRIQESLFVAIIFCLSLSGVQSAFCQEDDAIPSDESAKKVVTITEPEDIYQMSVNDLTKSEAAQAFKDGNFEKALKEFQFLAKLYPRDITIRRYIGICYDRLGKYNDAVKAFNDALMLFPYHVPTHFYKGLTFIRMGETQKGLNELKFVIEADKEGPYGQRALVIVQQVEAGKPITPAPKRWAFYGRYGVMYDDNVIIAPKDKALRGTGPSLRAVRNEFEGTLVYQLYQESKTRVTAEYGFSVSLNGNNLNEFNFYNQRWAIQDQFITEFLGKQFMNTVRHDVSIGWLDDQLFTVANTTTVSTSTSLFNQTRQTLYANFGYTEFGPDGSLPDALSRDGFYEGYGFNNTFFNETGSQWITLGYGWNGAQTRGSNFYLSAYSGQVSIHTPLIEKFYVDYTFAYQRGYYPRFNGGVFTETRRRRDDAFVMSLFLSRPLGDHFTWRAFYRWFDTQNPNDIFAFRRDIAGTEINVQF